MGLREVNASGLGFGTVKVERKNDGLQIDQVLKHLERGKFIQCLNLV